MKLGYGYKFKVLIIEDATVEKIYLLTRLRKGNINATHITKIGGFLILLI